MTAMKILYISFAVALIGALIEAKPQGSPPPISELTDNPKTSECPNGESFFLQCNRCSCSKMGPPGSGLCTLMACPFFQACPPGDDLRGACGEKCTCDDVTKVTHCEKKGCHMDPTWVRNEPVLAHAH